MSDFTSDPRVRSAAYMLAAGVSVWLLSSRGVDAGQIAALAWAVLWTGVTLVGLLALFSTDAASPVSVTGAAHTARRARWGRIAALVVALAHLGVVWWLVFDRAVVGCYLGVWVVGGVIWLATRRR